MRSHHVPVLPTSLFHTSNNRIRCSTTNNALTKVTKPSSPRWSLTATAEASGIDETSIMNSSVKRKHDFSRSVKKFDEDQKINSLRGAKNSGLVGVTRSSKIKYYTVATKQHDGLDRLKQSAKYYGIDLNVIGLDSSWTDGDVGRLENPGGGQKINILKKLQKLLN